MKGRTSFPLLILLATAVAGCMQTRHVETTSVTSWNPGPCPSAYHDSTYSERRWCGLWAGQPARIQP
jgi:hypothetical protein